MLKTKFIVAAATCLFMSIPVSAVSVFTDNFDGSSSTAPGVTATVNTGGAVEESVQGYSGIGPAGNQFGGEFLRNGTTGTTEVNLSGLQSHSAVTVSFLLAVIDSWDGTGAFGPDYFNLAIDGTAFQWSFHHAASQSFPNTTQLSFGSHLGFNTGYVDGAYLVEIALSHSNGSLDLDFFASGAGYQGGTDESWAIENLNVSITPTSNNVPDGGSTALLLGGVFATLAGLRKVRK